MRGPFKMKSPQRKLSTLFAALYSIALLSTLIFSTWSFADQTPKNQINCEATYRLFDVNGPLEQTVLPLKKVLETAATLKFNGELDQDQTAVSATVDIKSQSVMLTMVKGPDYVNGILSRASLTNGFARLSRTDEVKKLSVVKDEKGEPVAKEIGTGTYTLYKVECYSR